MPSNHGRKSGLGIDALVIGCSQTWTQLWSGHHGHQCTGHQVLSNMGTSGLWAWMLGSSDALEHGRRHGLQHGCTGYRMLSVMDVLVWSGYVDTARSMQKRRKP